MIIPLHVLPTWLTAASYSINANGSGWTNFTIRVRFSAAQFPLVTSSSVRVSFTSGTSGNLVIGNAYIGPSGTAPSFSTTPTRLTFSGSNGTTITSGSNVGISDAVLFALDPTLDHIVSFDVTADNVGQVDGVGSLIQSYNKAGADAATVTASGYTSSAGGRLFCVSKIEVLS